jgi:peptide/nickel transport system substrate-binding protein
MNSINMSRPRKVLATWMRAWIGILVGLLIALMGTFPTGAREFEQPEQPESGSIVIGVQADPAHLDPALADSPDIWRITAQVYETLTNYQPGGSLVEPGLADSWTVSADGLTWTFNLLPGVKFHDGTSLNASAVAYNLRRWWDPAHPFHDGDFVMFSALFGGFKGDPNCWLEGIASLTSSQVQLTLSAPHSNLPSILAHPALGIASPAAIQGGTIAIHPVGSGPFVFIEWAPGVHIRFIVNSNYRGAEPNLDGLTYKVIALDADRFAALQAGTVQVVPDLPGEYAALAEADTNLVAAWRPSIGTGYLGMNRGHAYLDNDLVRQAIAHAIDRRTLLVSFYLPGTLLAQNLLPPVFWGSDLDVSEYDYNPSKAQALLAQAGYPDGFLTTLALRNVVRPHLPNPVQTAQAIQVYLEAVGIQVEVVVYESVEFFDKLNNGELDLFLLGWTADYLHPDDFLTPILCGSSLLGFGPQDTVLCDTLEAARAETEFAAQEALYQWSTRRVHATLPLLPLAHARELLLVRREIHGVIPSPLGVESYSQTWMGERLYLPLTMRE